MPAPLLKSAPPARPAPAPLQLLLAAALAASAAVGLPVAAAAAGATSAGQALQAIDGDTLQSGGDILQLYGFDAPELGQICLRNGEPWQCGLEAAFTLQKLLTVSGSPVVCEAWREGAATPGRNGELIRVCRLGRDQDLAQAMLRNGYGMAVPGSFPSYGQIERQAREAGLGIWSSEFTPPWEWRQGRGLQLGGANPPAATCNVKGRLSGGERVYVVPTDADYRDAAADAADGRYRFCSDEAARQAGWRRAGETDGSTVR